MSGLPPLTPSASLRYPLVKSYLTRVPAAHSVVEVGPGQGAMAVRLATRFDYTGYEPDRVSFEIAEARLEDLGHGRIVNAMLPEEPEPASLLVAFEVLEHIEHDEEALRLWRRWVEPGGAIILSVPAHQDRFGPWDTAVGHFRRYARAELEEKLLRAGFSDPDVKAFGFPVTYLLEGVRNRVAPNDVDDVAAQTAASGRRLQPKGRLSLVISAATAPFRLLQAPFTSTDLGTGYVAFARNPR